MDLEIVAGSDCGSGFYLRANKGERLDVLFIGSIWGMVSQHGFCYNSFRGFVSWCQPS